MKYFTCFSLFILATFIPGTVILGQSNTFPVSGNVGIGTTNPAAPLEIKGSGNDVLNIIASGDGRGGIYVQNTNANAQATIYTDNDHGAFASYCGILSGGSINSYPNLFGLTRVDKGFVIADGVSNLGMGVGTLTAQPLVIGTNNIERIRVTPGGNILIGKTTQTNANYLLEVSGFIRASKLVVNTTGADFVFDKKHTLPSLYLVEKYIQDHHHLQGIQSATQMQSEGVDLGENQTQLLQKIEELTLYIIKLNKEIEAIKHQMKGIQRTGTH